MQEEAKSLISDSQAYIGNEEPEIFLYRKFGYSITKHLTKFLDEYNWFLSQRKLVTAIPPEWLLGLSRYDH